MSDGSWRPERLADFKAPGHVAFIDRLPVTSTQKIQRRGLKELAVEPLSQQRCVAARSVEKRQVANESPRAAVGA